MRAPFWLLSEKGWGKGFDGSVAFFERFSKSYKVSFLVLLTSRKYIDRGWQIPPLHSQEVLIKQWFFSGTLPVTAINRIGVLMRGIKVINSRCYGTGEFFVFWGFSGWTKRGRSLLAVINRVGGCTVKQKETGKQKAKNLVHVIEKFSFRTVSE